MSLDFGGKVLILVRSFWKELLVLMCEDWTELRKEFFQCKVLEYLGLCESSELTVWGRI